MVTFIKIKQMNAARERIVEMIVGMSKELYKVEVDFSKFELEKLQSHEVFGLYLLGEITFNKLREIYRVDDKTLRYMIKRVCEEIDNTSNKDETEVEMDF